MLDKYIERKNDKEIECSICKKLLTFSLENEKLGKTSNLWKHKCLAAIKLKKNVTQKSINQFLTKKWTSVDNDRVTRLLLKVFFFFFF